MEEHLVPDTPAVGLRPDTAPVVFDEPSCCSPIRLKLNTVPIKLFSVFYIICGVLSIGLGVAAIIYECMYKGLSIPAGVLFIASGVIGFCVRKHGVLDVVFMFLSAFSFLYGIAILVFMLVSLPEREFKKYIHCFSHTCGFEFDECCQELKIDMKYDKVGIDLGILVVGVITMVTALLATTLSLRNMNWVKICGLKSNREENGAIMESTQTINATPSANESSGMKRCWKPCDGPCDTNSTMVLSIIHIIMGVVSVGLGIFAVFVECKFAHVGIPIWTGIFIFIITGVCGLLSASKKESYIPCFVALSILAFFLSINMFSWASVQLTHEETCIPKCGAWGCSDTSQPDFCYNCPQDCCYMDYNCNTFLTKIHIDVTTILVGVFEMLVCVATFGLSFSQLSCYVCCRGSCTSNQNY